MKIVPQTITSANNNIITTTLKKTARQKPSTKLNGPTGPTLSMTGLRSMRLHMMQKRYGKRSPQQKNRPNLFQKCQLTCTMDDLTCSLCLDIFVHPISTICGHNFCLTCYETIICPKYQECPCCRSPIQPWEIFRIPSVNRLVGQMVETLLVNEQAQYRERLQLCEQKIKRRCIGKKIKVRDLVDIKNHQNIWEIGEIIKIITKRGNLLMQVQSTSSGKIYTFNSKSFSIARFGYHTFQIQVNPLVSQSQDHPPPPQIAQPSILIHNNASDVIQDSNQLVSNIQMILNGSMNLDRQSLRMMQDRYLNELLMFD